MFCEISRSFSSLCPAPVSLFSAEETAMISVDDPAIPAPAGASESVASSMPVCGAKNFTRYARSGNRYFFAARSASSDSKTSSPLRSRDRRMILPSRRVASRQLAYLSTAKFTVHAPAWKR